MSNIMMPVKTEISYTCLLTLVSLCFWQECAKLPKHPVTQDLALNLSKPKRQGRGEYGKLLFQLIFLLCKFEYIQLGAEM